MLPFTPTLWWCWGQPPGVRRSDMKGILSAAVVVLGLTVLCIGVCAGGGVPIFLHVVPSNGTVQAELTWSADGGSV